MDFNFQIKNLSGLYYNGRNSNGVNWSKDSGLKVYHNVVMANMDALSLAKMYGTMIIVKRSLINGKWIEKPLKTVNRK